MKDVICDGCLKPAKYKIIEVDMKNTIGETEYNYKGKMAKCKRCGEHIYLDHLYDYNQNELEKVIEKENNNEK